jgi:N-acetylglucosamine kinase-like BadF-type ATPase
VIQSAIRIALGRAKLSADQIHAAGLGIAGASAEHSAEWLQETMRAALPNAHIAASSDIEIALVGAQAKRYGVIILAGTGSVAYGVNAHGESVLVGGWGYLLGDEGGGFWLGLQALKHATHDYDTRPAHPSRLTVRVLESLKLTTGRGLIGYTYGTGKIDVRGIAELASLVLEESESGEPNAQQIVEQAADALASLVRLTQMRLNMPHNPSDIAFAGGLLQSETPLSKRLCARLNLDALPQPTHPPVMGAALLAKLRFEEN